MQRKIMKNKFLIAVVYSTINLFCAIIFYPFIPILLNYPEGTVNTEFQRMIEGITYNEQFCIVATMVFIISLTWIMFELNKIEKLKRGQDEESIFKLRKSCLNLPYKVYLVQILVPTAFLLPILLIMNTDYMTTIRLTITVFSLLSIVSSFSLIFAKFIYTDYVVNTYKEYGKFEQNVLEKKYGIRKKILLQLIPIFLSGMLLFALVGYSKLVDEKGNLLYNDFSFRLGTLKFQYTDIDELKNDLGKLADTSEEFSYFIVSKDDKYMSDNNDISKEFIEYMDYYSANNGGRVYDYYTSMQGAVRKIELKDEVITVGIKYVVVSNEILIYYAISFVILSVINLFILIFFGKSIAFDVKRVSERLNETANINDIEKLSKLPITSDDEIGELEFAFNKIIDLEKEQIRQIKESQDILMEQERLVTLGQLAGGMAHDINTPLSSIETGIAYFAKRIEKDENTDMIIDALKKSIAKISNIVNSVRDQIRNLGSDKTEKFEISKIMVTIEALLYTELKKNRCTIETEKTEDIYLVGDIGKLEQVVTNIILNAVQAYENKGGNINVKIYKKDENAVIEISDEAGGIPNKIAESLLKQIVSTKGSRGTGFGLYFSNSIIKGVFEGELKFNTEEGKGTTFYIILPIKK